MQDTADGTSNCQDGPPRGSRSTVAAVCGLLGVAVALVFCQTAAYDFVNYDDDDYVYGNEHVNHGLTWEGVKYFAWHRHAYTYHPLTTYSHMLDCQLFDLTPGWHHAVNVVLHGLNAVLLFLLVRRMTGRLWPSALVAALFAVHPLHVQSVAWISERKDVLSGLFFFLTLAAYIRYVRDRADSRPIFVGLSAVCVGTVGQTHVGDLADGAAAVGLLAAAAPESIHPPTRRKTPPAGVVDRQFRVDDSHASRRDPFPRSRLLFRTVSITSLLPI